MDTNRTKKVLVGVMIALMSLSGTMFAKGTQTFSKELIGGTTRNVGEVITYKLKPACNSLTGSCGKLSLSDHIPAGTEIESCAVPPGFTVNQCSGTDIDITKDNKFDGGDTFEIMVKLRIKLDADPSTPITNTATSVITKPDNNTAGTINSSADSVTVSPPSPHYTLKKHRTTPIGPALDNPVSYKVEFCVDHAIDNVSMKDVVLKDTFPNGAEVIDGGGGVVGGNVITWDLGDINLTQLYANTPYTDEKCITKDYTLRYPSGTFSLNDSIANTLSATGTPPDGNNGPVGDDVTLNDTIVPVGSEPKPSKAADDVKPGEDLVWKLDTNLDTANAPTKDLVIYDTLPQTPAELKPKTLTSGGWNSPSTVYGASDVQAEVFAATDHAGDCTHATYTSLSGGLISGTANQTYTLNEDTTCVKWVVVDKSGLTTAPDIPVGWRFTTLPQLTQDTTEVPGPWPKTVHNCIKATHTDADGNTQENEMCADAHIEEPTPDIVVAKTATPNKDLKPGDEIDYRINFHHNQADSTGPSKDPLVADLLPPELEFVRVDGYEGLGGKPEPTVAVNTSFDDGSSSDNTLVTFDWSGTEFDETTNVTIKMKVRVKNGAGAATYTNKVEYFDHSGRFSCETTQKDALDLDGDGDTNEDTCYDSAEAEVITAAVLGGEKWIHGDGDANPDEFIDTRDVSKNGECPVAVFGGDNYTRYPCVAHTTKGSDFKYMLKVTNVGNVDLDHYVLYDMLPKIGDTGSGEPLSIQQRGTEWTPSLTGAITIADAPAGLTPTIEYSTAAEPCRPEVSSDADESGWQSGCTDDWSTSLPADPTTVTAFRITIADADRWHPTDVMLFSVPMRAPKRAPGSDVTNVNDLHPAWNSFAHRVSYGGGANRLATAEPRQVGIVLPRGPEVSIGSVVWADDDDSGTQDANESGIAGAKVELFFADGTPAVDRSGRTVAAQTTGADGAYFFDNLEEGNYTVQVTPPPHYVPSTTQQGNDNDDTPNDSNIKSSGSASGSYISGVFELTEDGEPNGAAEVSNLPNNGDDQDDAKDDDNGNMTVDFGFIPPVSIGSTVFYDYDDDGKQDDGEKGIAGVTVKLYASDGTTPIKNPDNPSEDYVVTTDANGNYLFEHLPKGSYVVGVTPPPNAPTSSTDIGTSGGDNQTDGDDNGIQTNSGEEAKSPVIALYPGTEPANGVEHNVGPDTTGDNQDDGDDDAGDMTVDFGFVPDPVPVSIGSTVFYDYNDNGIQDAGESGIAGVTVNLYADTDGDEVPDTDDVNDTVVTDANGNYFFGNLASGNYVVGVIPPNDAPTSSTDIGTSGGDNQTDGDDNGAQTNPGDEALSPVINLIHGEEPSNGTEHNSGPDTTGDNQDDANDTDGDMTVDFGFIPSVSIGSVVWEDKNRNGLQDAAESRIADANISLLVDDGTGTFVPAVDINGVPVPSQITDNNGTYFFDNLPAGDYRVQVIPPEGYLPTEHQTTSDDNGAKETDSNIATAPSPNTYQSPTITLAPGSEAVETTANDGDGADGADNSAADTSGDMTVDFGFVKPVSIGSVVWEDKNRDGLQDGLEPRISGATVHLVMEDPDNPGTWVAAKHVDGTSVTDITTGNNGRYFFDKLPEGNYKVQVTPPSRYVPTPVQTAADNNDAEKDSNINKAAAGVPAGTYESGVFTLTAGGEPQESTTDDGDDADGTGGDIADKSGNMTVDFGFVQPMSIGSLIWVDSNADGKQGSATNEPRIADANVSLLVDNGSGTYVPATDIDGHAVPMQTTDANGTYLFDNLPEGKYKVAVQVAPSYKPTAVQTTGDDNDAVDDSNVDDFNGTHYLSGAYTLTSGTEPTEAGGYDGDGQDDAADSNGNMTVDFGFVAPVSIGSVVWEDTNRDGQQGDAAAEPRISGATVHLVMEDPNNPGTWISAKHMDGTSVTDITTGNNGRYFFDKLPQGNYKVQVTPPVGYVPSPVQTAADNNDTEEDSNINTSAVGVPVGTYESGVFTLTAGGEPQEADSYDGDDQDGSHTAEDASGNMTVDFGFVQPVSIGSVVWEDTDKDGQQGAAEPRIGGATVNLLVDDGNGNFIPATDINGQALPSIITAADGTYYFGNLPEGTYKVQVTPPSQYIPSPVQTAADNNDTEEDSNIAENDGVMGVYTSGAFDLTVGGEPNEGGTMDGDDQDDATDANGNMTVDFGFVHKVSIGSTVFYDHDNNGLQDAGDEGISGATVTLYEADGTTVVATTTTNASGDYYFGNLIPGDYVVGVAAPAGAPVSSTDIGTSTLDNQTDGDDNGIQANPGDEAKSPVIHLEAGTEPSGETGQGGNQDAVDDMAGDMTVDFGFVPKVAIGSLVWLDANNNGIQDAGEGGIAGAIVTLLDAAGNPVAGVAPVTTGADGKYCFCNLPEGDYKVQVKMPAGYSPSDQQTTGDNDDSVNDSNIATQDLANNIFTSGTFTLSNDGEPAGESSGIAGSDTHCDCSIDDDNANATVDFGFYGLGSWSGNVSQDLDNDDKGDKNLAGVTIKLYEDIDGDGKPDGDPIATTTTDASGNYHFDNLIPGDYVAVEIQPAGLIDVVEDEGGSDNDKPDNGVVNAIAGHVDRNEVDLHNDFVEEDPAAAYRVEGRFVIDADKDEAIEGAKVELVDEEGKVVAQTNTGPDGHYRFDVPEGKYKVRFYIPKDRLEEGYAPAKTGNETSENGVIELPIDVGPNAPTQNLKVDAAIECGCADISSDSGDAMGIMTGMLMLLFSLWMGTLMLRKEEEQKAWR